MAYEVGVAYLSVVPTFKDMQRHVTAAGQQVQRGLGQAGEAAGSEAGGLFAGSFGKIMKAGAVVAVVAGLGKAAGAAFSSTFGEAMERESATTKASAQLGLSEADSKALGASAGKLYAQAYGDSFGEVTDALGIVKSSLKGLGGDELEGATKKALSFSSAFEVDMARSVQTVSTLMGSGLAKNSDEAFDLITRASQKVPAALREDVLDASDEYAQFFNALGFDGSQAFGALTAASDKGVFGIDKTGDAIKEFTIRATDMSASTTGAFSAIGLDAQTMANDILAGGDTAQSATQQIVDGLLGIQDPATQANTAIALFGTPIEDLGVQNIPAFLTSLQGATGGLGDFAGAAAEVDSKLGGTVQSKFESLSRTLGGIGPALGASLLPFIGPALDGLTGLATKGVEQLAGLEDEISGVAAAGKLLATGDFQGGIFGLEEDDPIIGILFNIRDAAIEIGGAVGGVFTEAWNEIWPVLKEVGAIIGPAVVQVFDSLWPAIQQLIPVFTDLLPLFNPVGVLFKALLPVLPQIATLVASVATMLGDFLAKALTALAPLFQKIVEVVGRLIPFISELVASLLPPLMALFDSLAPLLQAVLDALLPVVDAIIAALIPAIDALMPIVERVFTFIADTIGNAVKVFQGIIDFVTGVFTGDWQKVWDGVKGIFGGIWDQIVNIVTTFGDIVLEFFTNLGPKIWEVITSLASTIVGWGSQFLQWLWDGIMAIAPKVWDWFLGIPGWIWERIWTFAQTLIGYGGTIITWIKDGIVNGATAIWDFITGLPGKIGELITGLGSKLLGLGKDLVGWIVDGVVAVAGTIWDAITDALTGGSDEANPLTGGQAGVVFGGTSRGGVIPGFAAGGVVPGRDPGRRDNVLAQLPNGKPWGLRSEESVFVPEFTRAIGGAPTVNAWNRLAEQGRLGDIGMAMGIGGFAEGGIVGTQARAIQAGKNLAWRSAQELIEEGKKSPTFTGNGNWGPTSSTGFAANTAAAKAYIEANFPGVSSIGGLYGGSVSGSDHPFGKALDVMIANYASQQGIAAGTTIADWFINNPNSFGTKYVIWRDRINQNGQWAPYSHPSGNNDTLAHRDHVHLSFLTGSGEFSGQAVGDTTAMGGRFGALVKKARDKLGIGAGIGSFGLGADPGGSGVQRWLSTVQQALSITGQSPSWASAVLKQMDSESSGNPMAINDWDRNAANGTPSKGLMQVIDPTFRSYALPGYNSNIYDPLSNIIASIRYAVDRYGSLGVFNRAQAYDQGGWLMPNGGQGVNLLNKPEAVLTPAQSQAYLAHARDLEAGFAGGAQVLHAHIQIGDHEIKDFIVDVQNDGVAQFANDFARGPVRA